jgi:hypothetical protein
MAIIRKTLREGNMESPNSPRPKNRRETGKEQSQQHAHHFLRHQGGLFTNSSPCQVKQPIPHTTVTLCGDCVKMCEDFFSNFGDKGTGCCITTTRRLTLPFLLGIFDQKQHDCPPFTLHFFVLPIKDKTERPSF